VAHEKHLGRAARNRHGDQLVAVVEIVNVGP
jgi:hypothetical protein